MSRTFVRAAFVFVAFVQAAFVIAIFAPPGWAAPLTESSPNSENAQRPNVIFILADDLGWTDTATYGSRYYETPHIDRLAAQGLK